MGELYFDTENLFRGSVAQRGVPHDRIRSAQEGFLDVVTAPGHLLTPEIVARAIDAIIRWHEPDPAAKSTIYSFGKRGDSSVRLFLGAVEQRRRPDDPSTRQQLNGRFRFDEHVSVIHQHVGTAQHAGERALLAFRRTRMASAGTRVAVGSADHDALLAFDHEALDGPEVDVVLPAKAIAVTAQVAEDGRYPHLHADRTRTIGELLAGDVAREARSGLLRARRRRDADAISKLGLGGREGHAVHHEITGILRVDVEGVLRQPFGSAGWKRAIGERWVHEAVVMYTPDVASADEVARFVAGSLTVTESAALIARAVVLRSLTDHPRVTPTALRAYAEALAARTTYAAFPGYVDEVLPTRTAAD